MNNISGSKRFACEIFAYSSGRGLLRPSYSVSAILIRAGVDGGAPLLEMSKIITEYTKILTEKITFEELCHFTSEIMEKIMNVIYENREQKQTNQHLINAINYIKDNYHKDLSLETVARNVFVSNYYLSHLFRE